MGSFFVDFDRIVPNKNKKETSRYRIIIRKDYTCFLKFSKVYMRRFSWDSIVDYDAKLKVKGDSIAESAFIVNRTRKTLGMLN